MRNRRRFLVEGSLAATAMLVLKPMQTIAGEMPGLNLLGGNVNNLVFLHTSCLTSNDNYEVIRKIKGIQNSDSHAILLNTAGNGSDDTSPLKYDASLAENTANQDGSNYKIVQKGRIRSGIISVTSSESNVIDKVNHLAAYLKKEKKCTMVVCLSNLGYKSNHSLDDITLASQSSDVDIIIGGHPENFHPSPVIALNNRQAEVIIHSSGDNSFGYGKVAIDFDERGRKKQVCFVI